MGVYLLYSVQNEPNLHILFITYINKLNIYIYIYNVISSHWNWSKSSQAEYAKLLKVEPMGDDADAMIVMKLAKPIHLKNVVPKHKKKRTTLKRPGKKTKAQP